MDKALHFIEYALLGALLFRALRHDRSLTGAFYASFAIASLYGMTDEYHQRLVAMREPDLADVAADAFGALAGTLSCYFYYRRLAVE